MSALLAAVVWVAGFAAQVEGSQAAPSEVRLEPTNETTDPGFVEIIGVSAGPFDPALWHAGTLNLLPDVRAPLLEPLPGKHRNIYAPSAVELPGEGWRLFYGAWDGVATPNDRIYSVVTRDWLSFEQRHTVIEHNQFIHVCNVNALRSDDGSWLMVCTAYPDANGQNKPITFASPDGRVWNGSPAPYPAKPEDIVQVHGYTNYAAADINGMNVLLNEQGKWRLYFGDFHNFGHVFRASGTDGRNFEFDGPVLEGRYAVNDVKKFRVGSDDWYLMGLHMNREQLWFSLSHDGLKFPPVQPLLTNLSTADRYIVALGWVVQGQQEKPGRRLLGVLYGAGSAPSLDQNRIFARWLQPRLVFVSEDGQRFVGERARGPERQLIPLPDRWEVSGRLELSAEDGRTLLATSRRLRIRSGQIYRLVR